MGQIPVKVYQLFHFSHSGGPSLCGPHGLQHARPPCHQLPESTQTHVHRVGDAIQPSHPLLFPSPPALNLSQHQGLFQWPKHWSFSLSISPSSEYSGLISFRLDWLDLLIVQGTLKSLLQQHSSKASILGHSAFFIVQLSHLYMTTGETIALTRQTFVSRIMSLLYNMLSRLVITLTKVIFYQLFKKTNYLLSRIKAPLMAQMVKNPPAMREAWV